MSLLGRITDRFRGAKPKPQPSRAELRLRRALSVHRAAEVNRFTKDWVAPQTSADSAIVPDLPKVNARARQIVRDDAYARSIVRSFVRNGIGTGITAAIDDKPYARGWRHWSTSRELMDLECRRDFIQMQRWAVSELVTVGEAFVVRWIVGEGDQRRLRLQCFEFEQLDTYKLADFNTGNHIRHGIEVDENGAPVAYHFYRHHPNDIRGLARPAPLSLESFRVPAKMVCHIYDPERCLQTHGISRLSPVLRRLRDLAEYDAAELRAARAEANIGLLIEDNAGPDESDDATDDTLQLDGLSVAYLTPGEKVTPFTPSRPGNTYDPFVKAQLKAIAAGVGISYDQIARDFDGGSYSSKRQGAIEDRREWEPLQALVIGQLCEPVMADYLDVWAMKNPALSGNYFLTDAPEPVDWQGQGWEWVDPEQQGKGVERMMRLGLTNRTIEANKLGRTVRKLDQQAAVDGTARTLKNLEPDKRENPAPEGVTDAV